MKRLVALEFTIQPLLLVADDEDGTVTRAASVQPFVIPAAELERFTAEGWANALAALQDQFDQGIGTS